MAAKFLRRHGYRIVARNYRAGHLELDIVAVEIEACFAVDIVSAETEAVADLINYLTVFNKLCGKSIKIRVLLIHLKDCGRIEKMALEKRRIFLLL